MRTKRDVPRVGMLPEHLAPEQFDAEREDDAGISSTHPTTIDCQSFPVGSYALDELPQGSGNIQVKP